MAVSETAAGKTMSASETALYETLAAVMPTYHLAMDGEPDEAATYRVSSVEYVYESGVPILCRDNYEITVLQREHVTSRVADVETALRNAGFGVRTGQQDMASIADAGYSVDTFTVSKTTIM